jgi:hypothetical protein
MTLIVHPIDVVLVIKVALFVPSVVLFLVKICHGKTIFGKNIPALLVAQSWLFLEKVSCLGLKIWGL